MSSIKPHLRQLRLDETDWVRAGVVGGVWAALLLVVTSIHWLPLVAAPMPGLSALGMSVPPLDRVAVVLLAPAIGALIAAVLHPMALWTAMTLVVAALVAVGMSYYSYAGINLWWALPILGFLGAGFTTFHLKDVARQARVSAFRMNLGSFLPDVVVQRLLAEPATLLDGDRQVTGSVLAVEIGSFMSLAVKQGAGEVRDVVKFIYEVLKQATLGHGGVIVPGHRNGFLCVFGDLFYRDGFQTKHAEAALQCAIAVQKACGERSLRLAAGNQLVIALKCGISSGRVNVGNIGDATEIVPFHFGEPVEQARHLQRACDANRILISSITKDMLVRNAPDADWLTKRMINSPFENEDLVEAFEFDPFHADPDTRRRLTEAIRNSQKRDRKDDRWPVKFPERVKVLTSIGEGELQNLSRHGLGLRLGQALGIGTTLRLSFVPADESLNARLTKRGIGWITAEVRWTSAGAEGCSHGFIYKNLPSADKEFLFLCLLDSQEARPAMKMG